MGQFISMAAQGMGGLANHALQRGVLGGQKTIGLASNAAQDLLNEVNVNAANTLRGENNTLLAAKSALANMQRSGKNMDVMKATGDKVDTINTTRTRLADARTAGTLEQRIGDAEQQGMVTAAAAASGTGGSGARMLKLALAASSARKSTAMDDKGDQQSFDLLMARNGLISGVITQLDQGQTFAPIDVSKSSANKIINPMWDADYQGSKWQAFLGAQQGQAMGAAVGSMYKAVKSGYDSYQTNKAANLKMDGVVSTSRSDYAGPDYGAGSKDTGYGAGNSDNSNVG